MMSFLQQLNDATEKGKIKDKMFILNEKKLETGRFKTKSNRINKVSKRSLLNLMLELTHLQKGIGILTYKITFYSTDKYKPLK